MSENSSSSSVIHDRAPIAESDEVSLEPEEAKGEASSLGSSSSSPLPRSSSTKSKSSKGYHNKDYGEEKYIARSQAYHDDSVDELELADLDEDVTGPTTPPTPLSDFPSASFSIHFLLAIIIDKI